MNAERLLLTASFLDTLPPEKFNFNVVAREEGKPMLEALAAGPVYCGTVGCALGWTPKLFPELVIWARQTGQTSDPAMLAVTLRSQPRTPVWGYDCWDVTKETAMSLFDLSERDVYFLFHPDESGLGDSATPSDVANHIRQFVEDNS